MKLLKAVLFLFLFVPAFLLCALFSNPVNAQVETTTLTVNKTSVKEAEDITVSWSNYVPRDGWKYAQIYLYKKDTTDLDKYYAPWVIAETCGTDFNAAKATPTSGSCVMKATTLMASNGGSAEYKAVFKEGGLYQRAESSYFTVADVTPTMVFPDSVKAGSSVNLSVNNAYFGRFGSVALYNENIMVPVWYVGSCVPSCELKFDAKLLPGNYELRLFPESPYYDKTPLVTKKIQVTTDQVIPTTIDLKLEASCEGSNYGRHNVIKMKFIKPLNQIPYYGATFIEGNNYSVSRDGVVIQGNYPYFDFVNTMIFWDNSEALKSNTEYSYTVTYKPTNTVSAAVKVKTQECTPTLGRLAFRVVETDQQGRPTGTYLNDITIKLTDTSGKVVQKTAKSEIWRPSSSVAGQSGWVHIYDVPVGNYGVMAYGDTYSGSWKLESCASNGGSTVNATIQNENTDNKIAAWDNNVTIQPGQLTLCKDLGLKHNTVEVPGSLGFRITELDQFSHTGRYINDVTVKLTDINGNMVISTAKSAKNARGEDGWVKFNNVAPAAYGIMAYKTGFAGNWKQVDCSGKGGSFIGASINNKNTEGLVAAWDASVIVKTNTYTVCRDLGLKSTSVAPAFAKIQDASVSATASPKPSVSPSASPSIKPSANPTVAPTPSAKPSTSPSPKPTVSPTPIATVIPTPTAKPSITPTPKPSAVATPSTSQPKESTSSAK